MIKNLLLIFSGLVIGVVVGYLFINLARLPNIEQVAQSIFQQKQIIGFLPYWQLSKAKIDYTSYITTLAYFGLTTGPDGSIVTMSSPQSSEPGFYALTSGKVEPFLNAAEKNNLKLSLVINSGDQSAINQMISTPRQSANNLISSVKPFLNKYKFSDLNLDIESTSTASDAARDNFITYLKTVKNGLDKMTTPETLTIEISPTDLIRKDLIDPQRAGEIADYVVVMAYDYHYTNSYVTGPVAPLNGAGETLEYDTASAMQIAQTYIPDNRIILGFPLYGYEWETLNPIPQSAIIPNTGIIDSNKTTEKFLSQCASCSAKFNSNADEYYVIYKDQGTGTYHQMFYPEAKSTQDKIDFAKKYSLGGVAIWALGYEGSSILEPLKQY